MKKDYNSRSTADLIKNPPKEPEPNEFADFKKHGRWGRPSIEDKEHPWFEFFNQKFDCTGFVKNAIDSSTKHEPNLPINLYSAGFDGVRVQFDTFLKNYNGYEECSGFFKKWLGDCFYGEVSWSNRGLPSSRFHDGKNLSRGCLGNFLNNVWKITYTPEMLTENDRKFIMKYCFCVTKKYQIELFKVFLKHTA